MRSSSSAVVFPAAVWHYSGDAPRLRRFYLHFRDYLRTHLSITAVAGRDYA
jgi:hypothetical protein